MFPSNSNSWRREIQALVRCLLQIHKFEDVKTKLSCDASFKFEKLKMWKQIFRAMFPSNSRSWRCENEALVQRFLQMWEVEDVKTQLSCDASFKFEKFKMWKRSFRAMFPSNLKSWRREIQALVRCLLQIWKVEDMKTIFSCDAFLKFEKWKMWKGSFRAMPPSSLKSGRCENESFVRCFLEILRVEDVKTMLSCDASFKIWKVEDMKSKLCCSASFKFVKLKMWKRSFRAMPPSSNSKSWRCENKAFVRWFLQIWKVEDVKAKLSCDASFKF